MADKKISALPTATTPLAGTEVLPVVQSGATDQVSVANLTAGRSVSGSSFSASTGNFIVETAGKGLTTLGATALGLGVNSAVNAITINTSSNVGIGTASPGTKFEVAGGGNIRLTATVDGSDGIFQLFDTASSTLLQVYNDSTKTNIAVVQAKPMVFYTTNTSRMRIEAGGDITAVSGNVVIGTAGKGIDFSANGGDILTQYDEGDWTPNQGAGLTVVGAFSSSGKYTRIGRQVTVTGQVNGATSVLVSASGVISTNLPFTSGVNTLGIATNSALSVVGGVFVSSGTTNLSATVAIGATSTIYFQVTYFV